MELAILYWFYKEPEVTKNHLELIRKNNPKCKVYGLFGGEPAEAQLYQDTLGELVDDFWVYTGTYGDDSYTKWIHGDLMILDWYDRRGRDLSWDSIAILQWDMVLFADIKSLLPGLKKDQVFFSGYRELSKEVENRWSWTKPGSEHRQDYLNFTNEVRDRFGYDQPLKCCIYILEILTREFFEKYLEIEDKKLGMLEYKNPTLANIFGLDIYEHDVGMYWQDTRQSTKTSPLNGMSQLIDKSYIETELAKPDGWRLFHPYHEPWDNN